MSESFRNALRVHIQNASLYGAKERLSLLNALATVLVFMLAAALIVVIGMT